MTPIPTLDPVRMLSNSVRGLPDPIRQPVTNPATSRPLVLARTLLDKLPVPGEYFVLGCQLEHRRGLKGMQMDDRPERRHGRRYPIQLPLVHTPRALRAERGGRGWTTALALARFLLERP